MLYEVKSKRDGKTVVAYTESLNCIGDLDEQKSILNAGYKISFSGTQKEYNQVRAKLDKRVAIYIDGKRLKAADADTKDTSKEPTKRKKKMS